MRSLYAVVLGATDVSVVKFTHAAPLQRSISKPSSLSALSVQVRSIRVAETVRAASAAGSAGVLVLADAVFERPETPDAL